MQTDKNAHIGWQYLSNVYNHWCEKQF